MQAIATRQCFKSLIRGFSKVTGLPVYLAFSTFCEAGLPAAMETRTVHSNRRFGFRDSKRNSRAWINFWREEDSSICRIRPEAGML